MIDDRFPAYPLDRGAVEILFARIAETYAPWGPVVGADGVCRLQPIEGYPDTSLASIPMIPVKKLLLPPREKVWSFSSGTYQPVPPTAPVAVFGMALCDLQAVNYLDRVFAEDEPYQRRRGHFLLIGGPCRVGDDCRCQPDGLDLAGDLFIEGEKLWVLSSRGGEIISSLGWKESPGSWPLPWPECPGASRPKMTEELFAASARAAVWHAEGQRCLSCGACSAVCPTCYCFDLVDETDSRGAVKRTRVWDNCFFASHGSVAGGFDFRPDRADRLRFRMEHKRLGFGDLRGVDSCVGCGRCRSACPVNIDLDAIVDRLAGGDV